MFGLRRKRKMARIHLTNDQPSVEGVLMGRIGRSHYLLEAAAVIENENATYDLEGRVLVPVERVAFIQVFD